VAKSNDLGGGKARLDPVATDPINHFRHQDQPKKKSSKRTGYDTEAAKQTWTWAQDLKVIESLGLETRPVPSRIKFSIGADGQRYFNMFGREDLLPAATRDYIKCDRPARRDLITFNDKERLPYFLRDTQTKKRPVHNHWQSDDMWAVMRNQTYLETLRDEPLCAGKPRQDTREPSLASEDESVEWMNPTPRLGQSKENAPPHGLLRDNYVDEDAPAHKMTPWMALDAASIPGETPRMTTLADSRGPVSSMTPRSVSRCDTTPRSITPRSSIAHGTTPRGVSSRNVSAQDVRLRPSPSAPSLISASSRDVAYQVATPLQTATPRGGTTPRSMTPRNATTPSRRRGDTTPRGVATPRSNTTPRGDTTPRGGTTPRDLSMMPQMVSRPQLTSRGSTPRACTPSGSVRGMRKSASEVVIGRNS